MPSGIVCLVAHSNSSSTTAMVPNICKFLFVSLLSTTWLYHVIWKQKKSGIWSNAIETRGKKSMHFDLLTIRCLNKTMICQKYGGRCARRLDVMTAKRYMECPSPKINCVEFSWCLNKENASHSLVVYLRFLIRYYFLRSKLTDWSSFVRLMSICCCQPPSDNPNDERLFSQQTKPVIFNSQTRHIRSIQLHRIFDSDFDMNFEQNFQHFDWIYGK